MVPKEKFAEQKLIWVTKLFGVCLIFCGLAMISFAVDDGYISSLIYVVMIVFGFVLIVSSAWLIWRLVQVSYALKQSQIINHKS
jgi:uncharacterized membrane protein